MIAAAVTFLGGLATAGGIWLGMIPSPVLMGAAFGLLVFVAVRKDSPL